MTVLTSSGSRSLVQVPSVPFPVLTPRDYRNRLLFSRFFPPPIQVLDYHLVPVDVQDFVTVSQGHGREL